MTRLIDADKLPFHECADSDCIEASKENCAVCEFRCVTKEEIDNAPTVEPERQKGEWIDSGVSAEGIPVFKCSICNRQIMSYCLPKDRNTKYPFCNCGADMRKGGNNEKL